MKTKIIPIRTGMSQTFLLVQDGGFFLVDAGDPNTADHILKTIHSRGLKPEALKFIFLTHTHYDHAGNAAVLKRLSGAKVLVHQSEADYLRRGFHPIPNGTNALVKGIVWMGRHFTRQAFAAFDAVEPDILFAGSYDLQNLGFEGHILHTPGHTLGSSVLVTDRKAYVGDTLFNLYGIRYPVFANDEEELRRSWHRLLQLEVDFYYPAHGKRLSKTQLEQAVKKKKWLV